MRINKRVMLQFENQNEEVFEEFFKKYSPRMYYYISKCGLYDDDADDCIQDVFEHVICSYDSFRFFKGSFKRWVYKICKMHTHFYIKNLERKGYRTVSGEREFMVSNQMSADKLAMLSDVERYVGELNYSILVLRFYFDLTYREIGKTIGISGNDAWKRFVETCKLVKEYKKGIDE